MFVKGGRERQRETERETERDTFSFISILSFFMHFVTSLLAALSYYYYCSGVLEPLDSSLDEMLSKHANERV